MRGAALATALAAVSFGAGCQEDFDPYHRLQELRVMAVKAEPASPSLNETSTLSALIHTLPGQTVTNYVWQWCPFPGPASEGYPCIPYDRVVEMTMGVVEIPPYLLGQGKSPTANFTNVFPPELLAQLCAGAEGSPFLLDCDNGFPIQIQLRVEATGDVEDAIDVVWTMRLPIDPKVPPNQNPIVMPDLFVADIGGQPTPISDVDKPTATLARDVETIVRFEGLNEDASEPYRAVDDDGQLFDDWERLTVSWFVESGDIDEARTAFVKDLEPIEDTRRNGWTPALREDYDRSDARIYVIIRDNRGGVTWAQGRVLLEDSP